MSIAVTLFFLVVKKKKYTHVHNNVGNKKN